MLVCDTWKKSDWARLGALFYAFGDLLNTITTKH